MFLYLTQDHKQKIKENYSHLYYDSFLIDAKEKEANTLIFSKKYVNWKSNFLAFYELKKELIEAYQTEILNRKKVNVIYIVKNININLINELRNFCTNESIILDSMNLIDYSDSIEHENYQYFDAIL